MSGRIRKSCLGCKYVWGVFSKKSPTKHRNDPKNKKIKNQFNQKFGMFECLGVLTSNLNTKLQV